MRRTRTECYFNCCDFEFRVMSNRVGDELGGQIKTLAKREEIKDTPEGTYRYRWVEAHCCPRCIRDIGDERQD